MTPEDAKKAAKLAMQGEKERAANTGAQELCGVRFPVCRNVENGGDFAFLAHKGPFALALTKAANCVVLAAHWTADPNSAPAANGPTNVLMAATKVRNQLNGHK